ncbi:MAG: hypothetical protein MJZ38_00895 [archaeon]|nr:hypothetical protein [archaeon]
MWKEDLDRGCAILGRNDSKAIGLFTRAAEDAPGRQLQHVFDTVCDSLLEGLLPESRDIGDLGRFTDLCEVFLYRSEGEMELLVEMVDRAPAFVEPGNAFHVLSTMTVLAHLGLMVAPDPFQVYTVLDSLGGVAATAGFNDPGSHDTEVLSKMVFELRNEEYEGDFEDQILEIVDWIEWGRNKEVM